MPDNAPNTPHSRNADRSSPAGVRTGQAAKSTLRQRLRNAVTVIIILGIAILGFIALRATGPEAPAPQVQERQWPVAALEARPRAEHPDIALFARAQHLGIQTLTARIDGDVIDVPARAGRRYAPGDLLVQLDPLEASDRATQRNADLEDARAAIAIDAERLRNDERAVRREREQVAIAERALERAQDLRRRQLASDNDVDQAQNTLETTRLRLEQREQAIREAPARLRQLHAREARAASALELAQRDLAATSVRASVDGRVLAVEAALGNAVRSGATLVRFLPDAGFELVATIPNRAVETVREALARGERLAAYRVTGGMPEAQPIAHLERLAAEIRPGETGLRAFFTVERAQADRLSLDEHLSVLLQLPRVDNVVRLPREALFDNDRVYAIVEGRLRSLAVERVGDARTTAPLTSNTGEPPTASTSAAVTGSEVLVRLPESAPENARLLITRLPNAIDGLAVRVVENPASAEPATSDDDSPNTQATSQPESGTAR
ncbi:MAG: HlyD family secretion protein [Thioalkalivibrionaceae bacterium]